MIMQQTNHPNQGNRIKIHLGIALTLVAYLLQNKQCLLGYIYNRWSFPRFLPGIYSANGSPTEAFGEKVNVALRQRGCPEV